MNTWHCINLLIFLSTTTATSIHANASDYLVGAAVGIADGLITHTMEEHVLQEHDWHTRYLANWLACYTVTGSILLIGKTDQLPNPPKPPPEDIMQRFASRFVASWITWSLLKIFSDQDDILVQKEDHHDTIS